MYLKSIEVHGFKSFANKIVFDFHNGITGIVGPNGSGKSNVADAVRWVLGEQSAKQLRGSSMQDVIFAGTENRRPVSYAYVAITLDNADHMLPVEYEEVTIARRVYRSGESEYLLNGTACRLRDVYELFYDTGIGKEGYSIIGQGQIEQILSGRPEERRELFDEAAGIVKFKRRKASAQKKLEHERENLVRIHDILSELERQVTPLEKQAEKAKTYIRKKEELKIFEVNLFLLETESSTRQLKETEEKYETASVQLEETNQQAERVRAGFDQLEQDLDQLEAEISQKREKISSMAVEKGRMEGEVNVLLEQIHTAQTSREHYEKRREAIVRSRQDYAGSRQDYEQQKKELGQKMAEASAERSRVQDKLLSIQKKIAACSGTVQQGKDEVIALLNRRAGLAGEQQRYDMMLEQAEIRSAELNRRRILRKSEEADLDAVILQQKSVLEVLEQRILAIQEKEKACAASRRDWSRKLEEARFNLDQTTAAFHKTQSRLETLRNIAERYDGYGGSIRRVMEQKAAEPGIHGVVADLMKVDKKYETAIETALGGSIQNIVTKDEETAKKMVRFLKENKYGRATFLPLTSVSGRNRNRNERALACEGVIGMADALVKTQPVYEGIMSYLLGRVIVVDDINHAVSLAREFHYSLNIVTLEGEHLSPGGSISGGAFRSSSNLLGRRREIEELQVRLEDLKQKRSSLESRICDIQTAEELIKNEQQENNAAGQDAFLEQNTAQKDLERMLEQRYESERAARSLVLETEELEKQKKQIHAGRSRTVLQLEELDAEEKRMKEEAAAAQEILEQESAREQEVSKELSDIQLEEANFAQKAEFIQENLKRIDAELEKLDGEQESLAFSARDAEEDVERKEGEIRKLRAAIQESAAGNVQAEKELKESALRKEKLSADKKELYRQREQLTEQKSVLDKELFRLGSQKEKLEETKEEQTNYMWTEYELTPHGAMELKDSQYDSPVKTKNLIRQAKEEIRALGDVNVNAIEEYKEVSGRYEFLKTQHDDLIQAEQTLLGIIDELDTGMRRQFAEKFAEIQREFDLAFKQLFGGGRGTLELVEDEEILESGIRIIAHPPGKKLQNMMQLSGGEKALTAIALLFAIQNLKPSPFCLLDEIEAALDDSNVGRFAKYLHKLTKNTQFIVITHRRGTMAAADRLYGITMQEKGVSALVSVSLIENDLQ